MKNVEFKAELRDAAIARAACRSIGARHIGVLEQHDTYFRVPTGRMKRRIASLVEVGPHGTNYEPEQTEYIVYAREDRTTAAVSDFKLYTEPEMVARFGTQPMHLLVDVHKRRELWLTDRARIHLDEVDGLGSFIEFECLVRPGRTVISAHREMSKLRLAFGPCIGEAIAVSYSDMMLGESNDQPTGEHLDAGSGTAGSGSDDPPDSNPGSTDPDQQPPNLS